MTTSAEAASAAAAAAAAAGVVIAPVALPDELDVLRTTMESVWGPEIVPPRNLLRGLALGGACLLVARADDRPVGFALGWLGWDGGVHFHSHQVGVQTAVRNGGVGLALKMAQRAQCLERGIAEMRWTFDPLLWNNARFNLVRLGARVVAFIPNCYGERRDAFNTGDITDRLEVSWRLDVPVGGAPFDADGHDVVEVPREYLRLRADDAEAALAVRHATRERFQETFAAGRPVVGWCDAGYVLGAPS